MTALIVNSVGVCIRCVFVLKLSVDIEMSVCVVVASWRGALQLPAVASKLYVTNIQNTHSDLQVCVGQKQRCIQCHFHGDPAVFSLSH